MNIGTLSRQALSAVSGEPIENKLLMSKKVIKQVEEIPTESSHRLCQDLRATLKFVAHDPNATGEQIHEAGTLLARVRKIDPRRQKVNGESKTNLAEQSRPRRGARAEFDQDSWMAEQLKPRPSQVYPDPRDSLFDVRLEERVGRITAAGLMESSPAHPQILATAFPEIARDDFPKIVLQVWFATKSWCRAKKSESSVNREYLSEEYRAIKSLQTAAITFINTNHIEVPPDPQFDLIAELEARD